MNQIHSITTATELHEKTRRTDRRVLIIRLAMLDLHGLCFFQLSADDANVTFDGAFGRLARGVVMCY